MYNHVKHLSLVGKYHTEYEKLNEKKVNNSRQVKNSMCTDVKSVI